MRPTVFSILLISLAFSHGRKLLYKLPKSPGQIRCGNCTQNNTKTRLTRSSVTDYGQHFSMENYAPPQLYQGVGVGENVNASPKSDVHSPRSGEGGRQPEVFDDQIAMSSQVDTQFQQAVAPVVPTPIPEWPFKDTTKQNEHHQLFQGGSKFHQEKQNPLQNEISHLHWAAPHVADLLRDNFQDENNAENISGQRQQEQQQQQWPVHRHNNVPSNEERERYPPSRENSQQEETYQYRFTLDPDKKEIFPAPMQSVPNHVQNFPAPVENFPALVQHFPAPVQNFQNNDSPSPSLHPQVQVPWSQTIHQEPAQNRINDISSADPNFPNNMHLTPTSQSRLHLPHQIVSNLPHTSLPQVIAAIPAHLQPFLVPSSQMPHLAQSAPTLHALLQEGQPQVPEDAQNRADYFDGDGWGPEHGWSPGRGPPDDHDGEWGPGWGPPDDSHYEVSYHKYRVQKKKEELVAAVAADVVWKVVSSYIFVFVANTIFGLVLKVLGLSDSYLETKITLGKDGKHPFEHYAHSKGEDKGSVATSHKKGWKPPKETYYLNNPIYHPASALYHHPTYQYYPKGPEYTLLGYDQHQAVKYAKKYSKKYAKKAGKYGLRPKPILPYIPAHNYGHQAIGWGRENLKKKIGVTPKSSEETENKSKGEGESSGDETAEVQEEVEGKTDKPVEIGNLQAEDDDENEDSSTNVEDEGEDVTPEVSSTTEKEGDVAEYSSTAIVSNHTTTLKPTTLIFPMNITDSEPSESTTLTESTVLPISVSSSSLPTTEGSSSNATMPTVT